jgi:hypothetical protein
MTKYLTEFVGTLFLVLTIGLAVLRQSPMGLLRLGSGSFGSLWRYLAGALLDGVHAASAFKMQEQG